MTRLEGEAGMSRNPNPFYHKHECEKCSRLHDCYHPSCRGEWYANLCSVCFQEHLDDSSAIVASWPEWKQQGVLGPLNTEG